jgi:uncharacterized repeat protein (TIGR04076 family)
MCAASKMPTPMKVKVTLRTNLKGCHMGSKVGDSWIIQEGRTSDRPMCLKIFYDLQQQMIGLHLAELGEFGDLPENRETYIYCVGPKGEPNLAYAVEVLHNDKAKHQ